MLTAAIAPLRLLRTSRDLYRLARRLYSPSEVSVSIPAARHDVYAVISDPRTYPRWLMGAKEIRSVDASFPRAGAGFDHRVGPIDQLAIDDETISLGAHAPDRLDLEVHAGPMTGVVEFRLRTLDQSTEITLRERPRGLWLAAMPLLRAPLFLRNRRSLQHLTREVATTSKAR